MIVIYGIESELNPKKAQMSNVLHGAMMKVLGMPEDKRAHRFIPMAKEDFYYPGGRSDAYTVVEINMMAGRTAETQKKLIHTLFEDMKAVVGIDEVDLEIVIKEQPAHCWGFRGMTGDEVRDLTYKVKV